MEQGFLAQRRGWAVEKSAERRGWMERGPTRIGCIPDAEVDDLSGTKGDFSGGGSGARESNSISSHTAGIKKSPARGSGRVRVPFLLLQSYCTNSKPRGRVC